MPCLAYILTFILTAVLYGKCNEKSIQPEVHALYMLFLETESCNIISDTYLTMVWLQVF